MYLRVVAIPVKIADGRSVIKHSYKFFQNTSCEYFPCHDTNDKEGFNCLFCYCPLYHLGEKCGGNFQYLSSGIKDCSECTFPHDADNYEKIINAVYTKVL